MESLRNLTLEQRLDLTQAIMSLLDDWGVSHKDKLILLDLPDNIKARAMRRFYQDDPFPEHDQVLERLDHLLGIADALHTSFPLNSQMAGFWLNKVNPRFNNQTPLNFMLSGGLSHIVTIRAHLDCAWDWQQDNVNC